MMTIARNPAVERMGDMAEMKSNAKGEVTVNEFRKEISKEAYDELNGWYLKIRFNDGSREIKLNPSSFARNEELKEIILDASEVV